MLQHVLLLLSSAQDPEPVAEIRWHADRCATPDVVTAMATTRQFRQLSPGQSTIAFYGDAPLGNRLLGTARFVGFEPLVGKRGRELYAESALYSGGAHPPEIKGMLLLRDVRVAAPGASLLELRGVITKTGEPLTVENLPDGAARLVVYYRRAAV